MTESRNGSSPAATPGRIRAHVTGWGRYVPSQILSNKDLERMVDTSDEWIVSRTGIRERRVAAAHETTASMGAVASLRAIHAAGIDPDEIDLILLATLTPDYWMPSTAALVKEAIGNTRAAAMDVAAACSGFVYGFATAQAWIEAGLAKHVLVIGAELLTRFLDYTDRGTCILFGDGAGAAVLSASREPGGALGIELTTSPEGAYMIWLPAGGAKSPPSAETIARGEHYIRMEGKETYRFATKTMATTALESVRKSGLQPSDISLFIPHQANVRIIEAVAKGLGLLDGPDLHEREPLREYLGSVRADRHGRGGQRGPRAGRGPHHDGCVRGRLHVRGRDDRVDGRSGTGASGRRCHPGRGRPRSTAGRLGLGRSDPARARGAHGPARAGEPAARRRRPRRARARISPRPSLIARRTPT